MASRSLTEEYCSREVDLDVVRGWENVERVGDFCVRVWKEL